MSEIRFGITVDLSESKEEKGVRHELSVIDFNLENRRASGQDKQKQRLQKTRC